VTPLEEAEAVAALRRGEVVAIPAESSYGLSALALDAAAVSRLFALKGRSETAPVPVLIPDASWLDRVGTRVPEAARVLAARHWPGALTIVVHASADVPLRTCGGTGKIGVRMPGPSAVADVVRALGLPIASTSANRPGEPPCLRESEVIALFPGLVVLPGPAPGGLPSTVVDATVDPPRVLRAGPVVV